MDKKMKELLKHYQKETVSIELINLARGQIPFIYKDLSKSGHLENHVPNLVYEKIVSLVQK
jgi:hypothetical protein